MEELEAHSPDTDGTKPRFKERMTVYAKELDVKSLITLLSVPVGFTLARSSRSTWIKVAFYNFHGSSDWYGLLTMTAGLCLIIFGIVSLLPFLSTFVKETARWITTALTASSLLMLIAIKIKIEHKHRHVFSKEHPWRKLAMFWGIFRQRLQVLENRNLLVAGKSALQLR